MERLTPRRLLPLAVVVALLAVAAGAAAVATPGIHSVPIPHPQLSDVLASHNAALRSAGIAVDTTPPTAQVSAVPAWLKYLVTYTFSGLVIAVIALVAWRLVRLGLTARAERAHPATPAGTGFATRREAVIAAVDDILATLDVDDGDPRAAVIASWVRLEDLAAEAGTPRHPGDSPTDLVERLLGAHQVSSRVLRSMADAYRTARYSTRPVDDSMRREARAALGQLRAELLRDVADPADELVTVAERRLSPAPRPPGPDLTRPGSARPPAVDRSAVDRSAVDRSAVDRSAGDPHAAYRRPAPGGDA